MPEAFSLSRKAFERNVEIDWGTYFELLHVIENLLSRSSCTYDNRAPIFERGLFQVIEFSHKGDEFDVSTIMMPVRFGLFSTFDLTYSEMHLLFMVHRRKKLEKVKTLYLDYFGVKISTFFFSLAYK